MNKEAHLFVYIDTGAPVLAGQMWSREDVGRASCTFQYNQEWLADRASCFALDPMLPLTQGVHNIDRPLFGAMGDSCPDRWGRILIQRAQRSNASSTVGKVGMQRTLGDVDYLLMVDDMTRHGALRFSLTEGGHFLAAPMRHASITLSRLEWAARHVMEETETQEELQLLLAPGTSLGGAHPKATLQDADGVLRLAKFSFEGADNTPILWESVALSLAGKSGIETPKHFIKSVNRKPVLLIERFDRSPKGRRVPFLSAMTMLNARDHEPHSYLEIADAIRQYGSEPTKDRQNLWKRIVFNIMVSNLDDHLRNHGFLHDGQSGWRLSPIYDLNPVPEDIKPKVLSTSITVDDSTASLEVAMSVHKYFDLTEKDALQSIRHVQTAVKQWDNEAKKLGIPKKEIRRMQSAFRLAEEPSVYFALGATKTESPKDTPSAWQRKRRKPNTYS